MWCLCLCQTCRGTYCVSQIRQWVNQMQIHEIILHIGQCVGHPVSISCHDDVIEWKHFPRYWPFVRGIHRSPMNSPHKGQWRGALMFSLISTWINRWVNNGEASDFRRYRAHYDAIVMCPVTDFLCIMYWLLGDFKEIVDKKFSSWFQSLMAGVSPVKCPQLIVTWQHW